MLHLLFFTPILACVYIQRNEKPTHHSRRGSFHLVVTPKRPCLLSSHAAAGLLLPFMHSPPCPALRNHPVTLCGPPDSHTHASTPACILHSASTTFLACWSWPGNAPWPGLWGRLLQLLLPPPPTPLPPHHQQPYHRMPAAAAANLLQPPRQCVLLLLLLLTQHKPPANHYHQQQQQQHWSVVLHPRCCWTSCPRLGRCRSSCLRSLLQHRQQAGGPPLSSSQTQAAR